MANFTGNLPTASLTDGADLTDALYLQLKAAPAKNQIQLIRSLDVAEESGLAVLMRFLAEYHQDLEAVSAPTDGSTTQTSEISSLETSLSQKVAPLVVGMAYQVLFNSESAAATTFLQTYFPQGIVPLQSEAGVDYASLQRLLAEQKFQAADQLTLQKMCEVVGTAAVQRKWLYFTEVDQLPVTDMQTLNALWLVHSEGKFGFSVQREIWLSTGKNWDQLWSKIGWRTGTHWTRYPQEFTWDLSAPRGHLPLSNQLRGVRVIASLLAHPAWSKN